MRWRRTCGDEMEEGNWGAEGGKRGRRGMGKGRLTWGAE